MNWKHLKHFSLLLSLVFTRRLLTSGFFSAVEEGSRQTPERGKEENISRQINQKHSRVDFKSLTRCLQRNYFNNLLKCFIGWMKCVIFLIFSLLVGSLSVWLMTFPMVNEAIASDNFSSNTLRDVEFFFREKLKRPRWALLGDNCHRKSRSLPTWTWTSRKYQN